MFEQIDAVIPVPMHIIKRRKRTYNQAHILAKHLAKAFNLPVESGLIKKTVHRTSQTSLTAAQRRTNIRGAFKAVKPDKLQGRNFLIVDDVMTTGATVNEIAKVLKKAGAGKVFVVTVARG
ncbi:MAG: ComF family protein [Lentisphaerae bacterium]|nr:ComF family protein [Lentisphaerota bacterium]